MVGQIGNFDVVILLIDSKLLNVLLSSQFQLEEFVEVHLHWLVFEHFFGKVGNVPSKLTVVHLPAAGLFDISHSLVNRVIVPVIHND